LFAFPLLPALIRIRGAPWFRNITMWQYLTKQTNKHLD
jgi:hypothetical protein